MAFDLYEEQRQAIDAEILQLKLQVSSLCAKRNLLVPIANLPPELLCRIFLGVCEDAEILNKITGQPSLKLTWICRDWRMTALACSRLWNNIVASKSVPPFMPTFLDRSKHALLSVGVVTNDYSGDEHGNIVV